MQALFHPVAFWKAVYGTFFVEGISVHAAGLAFKTLLSLIPLGVVIATIYAVVEFDAPAAEPGSTPPTGAVSGEPKAPSAPAADEDGLGRVRHFVDNLFVPDQARKATQWIEDQVRALRSSSTPVTLVSLFLLAATAFFLFQTVEVVMNRIYQVRATRPIGAQVLAFWGFLTLGPLLLGASVYATAYVFSARFSSQSLPEWLSFLADYKEFAEQAVPFVFTLVAFLLLYWLVPNTHVRILPALIGALIAALLWEGMKRGFNYFLHTFLSYEPLYGSLATGVILLLWLYLSWYVALLGATIAFHVQYPPGPGRWPGSASGPRLALGLVATVGDAFLRGARPPSERALARRLNCPAGRIRDVSAALERAGILVRAESAKGGYVLARSPETLPLLTVYEALGDALGGRPAGVAGVSADAFFRTVDDAVSAALGDRTVADLLRGAAQPVAAPEAPKPLENPDPAP